MDTAALARLEHENMIETTAAAGGLAPGAVVSREGGVALVATGLPLRLFNQVIIERDDASPEAVAAAVAVTRARGDRFVVNLRRGTDDRYLPLMDELGLVAPSAEPWMPGMALHPVPTAGSVPPGAGHEIRRVVDSRGIRDHVETAAAGFEMPVSWVESIMTDAMLDRPDIVVYVGYTGGMPVTTGLGLRTGRTIGVYNIATVEAARRRGYGAAMTMRIVDDGAAAGCDVAILQASDMGYPIYERLGFRTVVEYLGYVDPASLQPQGEAASDDDPDRDLEPDQSAGAG
jgi:N-acetylglutamate synthase